jgi:bifunctional ADP-heptose synthase (sugar kinase/adenylyltransferase)
MKILVIGDSCEDIFRYGKVNRLAPEAPVPVINP